MNGETFDLLIPLSLLATKRQQAAYIVDLHNGSVQNMAEKIDFHDITRGCFPMMYFYFVGSEWPGVGVEARLGVGTVCRQRGAWTLSSACPRVDWVPLARSYEPISTLTTEARRPESKGQRRQVQVRHAH